jgi:hypothetical protein
MSTSLGPSARRPVLPGQGGASWDAAARARLRTLAVVAGLAAALFAWLVGEASFRPEQSLISDIEQLHGDAAHNAMMSYGALGAALGAALGLAGGLARRSVAAGAGAAAFGLALGLVAGAGTARLFSRYLYDAESRGDSSMLVPLLVHGATWVAVGVSAAGALTEGSGRWDRAKGVLLAGVAGALVAALAYDFAGMMMFPEAGTDRPVSLAVGTRLLAQVLPALCISVATADSAARLQKGEER